MKVGPKYGSSLRLVILVTMMSELTRFRLSCRKLITFIINTPDYYESEGVLKKEKNEKGKKKKKD